MSKKVKKGSSRTRRKTGGKGRDTRFKKGNSVGEATRFQPGSPGGPGRPPSLGSPRTQLKRYAEELAPEKLRKQIQKQVPDLDVQDLSWAQVIAIVHLLKAADGDMAALNTVYKQLEDSGADVVASKLQVTGKDGTPLLPLEAARAIAANFDKRHKLPQK